MPRFDGRVPMGMGPSTGWGMGFCGRGYIRPGMGFRHGYGRILLWWTISSGQGQKSIH